jgi:hypothetical protein
MHEYEESIAAVTLRRGPCFGSCPVYEVTLAADGTATWNGERFVDRLGHHRGQVALNEFGKLTRFIGRAGFVGWENEYVSNVTDLPNYFLTVVTDEQAKTVRQYGVDEPADFWVIATLVDHLADAIDWTAVPLEVDCRDWTAAHRNEPPGPSVLTVHGTCTFPTAGYSVELLRHEPQGINPLDLLLDRIVHPPTGPSAQVVTQVEAAYIEVTDVVYQSVTILPDGPLVPVEDLRPGEIGTADAPATPGAV